MSYSAHAIALIANASSRIFVDRPLSSLLDLISEVNLQKLLATTHCIESCNLKTGMQPYIPSQLSKYYCFKCGKKV